MCTGVCFPHYISCLTNIHINKIIFKTRVTYILWHRQSYFSNVASKQFSFLFTFFFFFLPLAIQTLALTEENNIGGKAAVSNDFLAWKF